MIREFARGDVAKIANLLKLSFAPSLYESELFSYMQSEELLLGWVHTDDGDDINGVVLYSTATRNARRIGWHLAPLAVHPAHQKRGIGSRLVSESLSCEPLASSSVFVLGNPAYYARFGFKLITNPMCAYDPGNKHFMALRWETPTELFTVGYSQAFSCADQEEQNRSSAAMNAPLSSVLSVSADEYLKQAANELVTIVDTNNQVVGSAKRSEMREMKLIHRATFAFIKNSKNLFYVQKRSMLKDYCPGYFDPTPGGVVAFDESYEQTNARELEEEMGILAASTSMEHLFSFYFEDARVRCFGDAWGTTYDGELKLQQTEVDSVEMMSMEDIMRRAEAGENFTPDSIFACKAYVKLFGLPSPLI